MRVKTMRRAGLVAVAVAAFSLPALADDYSADVGAKLGRGLSNLSLGWVELVKNGYNEPAQNGPMYAPVGLAKGVYHTLGRTLSGLAEMATFAIPTQPITHSPYVWDEFSQETRYGDQYYQ